MSAVTDAAIAPWQFEMYVAADIDRAATPEQLAATEANAHNGAPRSPACCGTVRTRPAARPVDHRRGASAGARRPRGRAPSHPGRVARLVPGESTDDDHREAADDSDDRDEELLVGTTQLQASWEPGRVVVWLPARAHRSPTRRTSATCSPPRAHPTRGGARTRRCSSLTGAPQTRIRFPYARCSAGSSPRAPTSSTTTRAPRERARPRVGTASTSRRACAGSGRVALVGRRAHCTRLDGAAAAPAHAPAARHAPRAVPIRCAGPRRWSIRCGYCKRPSRCPAPCLRSTARSTAERSRAPRSRAWSTRSVAPGRHRHRAGTTAARAQRDRGCRGLPRPPRRQRVRRAAHGHHRQGRRRGGAVGPLGHHAIRPPRPHGRATRPARRRRRLAPHACSRPATSDSSCPSDRRSSRLVPSEYYEEELARLERMVPVLVRSSAKPRRRGGGELRRGVAAHVHDRRAARNRRIRRPRPALSKRQAGRAAACTPMPTRKRWWARTSSRTSLVSRVRRRGAHRGDVARGWRRSAAADRLGAGGSRSTGPTCKPSPRRCERADTSK